MNNYEQITIKDASTQETQLEMLFDGFGDFGDYIIVNIDKEAQYIGRDIIDDLQEADGEYCEEDIIAKAEIVSDQIRNELIGRITEYLNNNW